MDDGRTHARFLFPWVMVLLAVGGGILGGFVRSGKRWAADLRDNVAIAAILGLIFYALAFFGAIGAIPKVPVEIGKVAAVNELGALVLGFVGGYYRPLFRSADRSR